jgi:DNA-binding CsgD family transcriptional regulator
VDPAADEPAVPDDGAPLGIVGREHELEQVATFMTGTSASRVLILAGAAGIGKTTLWEAALAHVRETDVRVLSTRGSAAEAKLSLTGVFDLLGPVADTILPELPGPQRAVLEAALLRSEPGRQPPGPRTLATALLTALRTLAQAGPLLVAVEDAQWVDGSSQDALAFAVRRLEDTETRVLLTTRTGTLSPLVRALERQALRLELPGLSLGATRRLLSQRLGVTPPRRLLVAIHAATRGNPLFALEIGRQVAEHGPAHASEPLPIPDDLPSLVGGRVAALPGGTQELLLAAALSARPNAETLRGLLGRPLEDDLEPAERDGVAFLRSDRVLFTHPLHAAGIVDAATTAERRRMHRRLAAVVDGLEERARHLAFSVEGSDERAASTVSAAAREALSRGAFTAAAELAELAVELGRTDSPERPQRLLDLAAFLRLAGEPARAHAVLAGASGWSGWPPVLEARGRGQLLLASYWADGATAAVELGERMLREDPLGDEVRATVHTYLGGCCEFDLDRSSRHVATALELLEQPESDPDPGTLAHALALRVRNGVLLGDGLDQALLGRVVELEGRLPPERFATEAMSPYLAVLHKHVDDLATSRVRLQALLEEAADTGNDVGEMVAGMHLALTELWAGDLPTAEAHLSVIEARVEEHGTRNVFLLAVRALVAAHRGDASTVRDVVAVLEAEHGAAGTEVYGIYLAAATGLLELSLGKAESADATFRRLLDALEAGGHREPGIFRVHANAGEAAVAVGDLERAEQIAGTLVAHADRTGHRWSRASGERVLALVAAARADFDEAGLHAERARAGYEAIAMPLEQARAMLVAGLVERRARRRKRARELLEESGREFERLGARLWADRARTELGRVSGRAPRGAHELTPAELRVVELAADGLPNKEIAKRLFVTVHTVELHLSHAYAKLGVRSRAQLAARVGRRAAAND